MKNICLIVLVLLNLINIWANEKDSLFIRLNKVLDNKEYYVINKEQNILNLKQMFHINSLSLKQEYEINLRLYEEYLKYQSDSAVHYILKNQEIAHILKDEELQSETAIHLAISVLSLFLIVGTIYTYLQMKRLSRIRKELFHTNLKLSELNNDLLRTNDQLKESNLIKEEYVAHFFDLCSTYIDKLENYRKTLSKQASNKQWNEVQNLLRSTSLIDTELEELYEKFDTIFLTLYPSFVDEYNALQVEDNQISLKPGKLLNTELRIFALIRLGITDSVKIAGFLRYSISTIYNYRVKARNNTVVPREQFEEKIMKIGNYVSKN